MYNWFFYKKLQKNVCLWITLSSLKGRKKRYWIGEDQEDPGDDPVGEDSVGEDPEDPGEDTGQEPHFEIVQVHRQTSFTDKIQIKACTCDDVVGTVGGYIGLFLGYACIQIPTSISLIFNSMKNP